MPNANPLVTPVETKSAVAALITSMVASHVNKGPTYPLQDLRTCRQEFIQAVVEACHAIPVKIEALAHATSAEDKALREGLKTALNRLRHLKELHDEASAALERAVVLEGAASPTQLVHSPESKAKGETVADAIGSFRTAVTDMATDGSDDAVFVRGQAKVGEQLPRSNPLLMKDFAATIVRNVRGPGPDEAASDPKVMAAAASAARLRGLLGRLFIDVEAFLLPIERGLRELVEELGKPLGSRKDQARIAREHAQIEVEQINAAILATVNGALGVAARDALREILPKTTQRTDARGANTSTNAAPPTPGPVASGTATTVTPGPVASGTATTVTPAAATAPVPTSASAATPAAAPVPAPASAKQP